MRYVGKTRYGARRTGTLLVERIQDLANDAIETEVEVDRADE